MGKETIKLPSFKEMEANQLDEMLRSLLNLRTNYEREGIRFDNQIKRLFETDKQPLACLDYAESLRKTHEEHKARIMRRAMQVVKEMERYTDVKAFSPFELCP